MAHYHSDDAPEDLKKAIHDGAFVDWYKNASTEQLESALRSVYSHYANYPLIQKEIDHRESRKTNEMLSLVESHLAELKKPHRIVKWTLVIAVATFLICLWTWLFPRLPVDANNSPMSQRPVAAPLSLPANLPNPESTLSAVIQEKSRPGPTIPLTNSIAAPASPKK
jgi:hypothetical protein